MINGVKAQPLNGDLINPRQPFLFAILDFYG
jgi:hypothetical protein